VNGTLLFSGRELTFTSLYAIVGPSLRLSSVCRLSIYLYSVTFVHPTQPENFTVIVPGKLLRWGFKRKKGSQI